jgi:aspartate oxidase
MKNYKKCRCFLALCFYVLSANTFSVEQLTGALAFKPLSGGNRLGKPSLMESVYAAEREYRTYYQLNAERAEEPVNELVVDRVLQHMRALTTHIDASLRDLQNQSAANKQTRCEKIIKKYHINLYDSFKQRALNRAVLEQGGKEYIIFYAAAAVEAFHSKLQPECLGTEEK